MRAFLRALVPFVLIGAPIPAAAAPCTLMRVEQRDAAKLIVFFTKFEGEDKTEGRYKACKLVKVKEDGTETFFVTPFRPDATVVVHPTRWPKG
jgi:hypothetical protein